MTLRHEMVNQNEHNNQAESKDNHAERDDDSLPQGRPKARVRLAVAIQLRSPRALSPMWARLAVLQYLAGASPRAVHKERPGLLHRFEITTPVVSQDNEHAHQYEQKGDQNIASEVSKAVAFFRC